MGGRIGFGLLLLFVLAGGCQTSPRSYTNHAEVRLPRWFTQPKGGDQLDAPVSLGVRLPKHFRELADDFDLPNWVIYGVVRCVGSDEFLANGSVHTFDLSDSGGEDSVTVDDVYYDVNQKEVRWILKDIEAKCAFADNEVERQKVLGRYLRHRFGSIVLFTLKRVGAAGDGLLLSGGQTRDAMEVFDIKNSDEMPKVGWRETPSHYITTVTGDFSYGNPTVSFRRTEEDAIRDLAKTLLLGLSHMRKDFVVGVNNGAGDDVAEDVYREDVWLRMRGVRVIRRAVDLKHCQCLVVVSVPRSGVSLR
jgi:hypothetical protein